MNPVTYFRVAKDPNANASSSVRKVCIHCGDEVIFLMTETEYKSWQVRGDYVQDVFPDLEPEIREWMISGTHPDCWNQIFAEYDEHEEEEYL